MRLQKGNHFCFTLNNYTPAEEDALKANLDITYLIYGHEVAPGTGTPHLQGYMQFAERMTPTFVKRINPRMHLENAKGSGEQNKIYCSKGTDIYEAGNMKPMVKGKRNDLSKLKEMTKDKKFITCIEECQNLQQIRYVEKLFEYKPLSAEFKKRDVFWFWGPTGSGKTKAAYEQVKTWGKDFWVSNPSGSKWFTGYFGQEIAILDEVRAGQWPYAILLRILDGYEIRLENKGGFVIWNPEGIIITAPKNPQDTYHGQLEFGDGHIDQLIRRITEVKEFTYLEENEDSIIET